VSGLSFAAIADDFTGAADLAGMLVRGGLRTLLAIGEGGIAAVPAAGADAIVVALKTRSIAAEAAVKASLKAVSALKRMGAERLYFKYCSTFDSTSNGNIGPVAEALRATTRAQSVVFVPSFPENGRRVYRGHLFVGDALLNESGMERHPLNSMRDANLVRVLSSQCKSSVGLIDLDTVRKGPASIGEALIERAREGVPLLIVDAIDDVDLEIIARAVLAERIVTGGSALGFHIGLLLRSKAWGEGDESHVLKPRPGRAAIIAGSCSAKTQSQIAHFASRHPVFELPVDRLLNDAVGAREQALNWLSRQSDKVPVLLYSCKSGVVDTRDDSLGIGRRIEAAFGDIARDLIQRNCTRLIVAGGETSGAVVQALDVQVLEVGQEIDSGVPWTRVVGAGPAEGLCLMLKSGNFGSVDLFERALGTLGEG
jgi:uncharacterized protein YgbK (DUF1537 family)